MMRKTVLILGALAMSFTATALATGQQSKQPTGPQEQPGPFGFPGVKHLTEVLMLSGDQAAALHRIYNDYQKKVQKAQQEANKEAQANKNTGGKPPRADTKELRDEMVDEIKAILTEDQRKKFEDLVSDMGKKKKKAA